MARAVARFHDLRFLTPMAAVAGAVAEEILEAMTMSAPLERAYVNNGGDIALHLMPHTEFAIGMIARPDQPCPVRPRDDLGTDAARGIATSGWRGRSFSLGIADAVTVIARDASHGRRGGDADRQRGRSARPSRYRARAGPLARSAKRSRRARSSRATSDVCRATRSRPRSRAAWPKPRLLRAAASSTPRR